MNVYSVMGTERTLLEFGFIILLLSVHKNYIINLVFTFVNQFSNIKNIIQPPFLIFSKLSTAYGTKYNRFENVTETLALIMHFI